MNYHTTKSQSSYFYTWNGVYLLIVIIVINRICYHRCDELKAYLLQKMAYEMMHRDLILRLASYLLGKIIHIFGKLRLYNIHTLLANCYILNVCFSLVSYFGIKIIVVFHFRNTNFKEKQCRLPSPYQLCMWYLNRCSYKKLTHI